MTDQEIPKWKKLGFPSERDWLMSGYEVKPGRPEKSRPYSPNNTVPKGNGATVIDLSLAQDQLKARINPDWYYELQMSQNGPRPTEYNAAIMLAQAPEFSGKIAWDLRALRPIQLTSTPAGRAGPWSDGHTANATMFAQKHKIIVKPKALETALLAISGRAEIDPLSDYLYSLEWDGQERIGAWLAAYCGAEQTPTTSLMGSKFLIGAVARALKPGCRMDYMLVLEGPQGIGKSTAVKILGGDYTAENLPDLHSKDAQQAAGCAWFVEVAELAALKKSEIEQVKSFLTRTADTFRPPYGRHMVTVPRWCVLIGNVNPSGNPYLVDSTGNRRFWPVATGTIDTAALKRDRNQLFAEAMHCYLRNDKWWVENEEQRLMLMAAQDEREQVDEWDEVIANWVNSQVRLGSFTGSEIARGALQIDDKDLSVAYQMRIAISMKRIGYVKKRETINGKRNWRYLSLNV